MAPTKITLSPEERIAYPFLFKKADKESLGVITGDIAVPFLNGAKLPGHVLGEIWQISDEENTGFLTEDGFNIAARLIGHAQNGATVSRDLIQKQGPLPQFEGITVPGISQPTSTSANITISQDDKAKWTRLFFNSGPSNGLLDGNKARDIFMKSNLPFETLGKIWNLSSQEKPSLDATDFVIAMALLQACMSGTLQELPDTLPPSLRSQASVTSIPKVNPTPPASPITRQMTGPGSMPGSPLRPQHTGNLQRQSTMPMRPFGTPALQQGVSWAVTPPEKQVADQFFATLDTQNSGFIGGEIAAPFFQQSGLPESTLAAIWDLADMRNDGQLNKDQFAVARYLIMNSLQGQQVPTSLPSELVPPSMRGAQQQTAPPGPTGDLFSLMDDDEPTTTMPLAPTATGGSTMQPLKPMLTGGSTFSQQSRNMASPHIPQQPQRSASIASTGHPAPSQAQSPPPSFAAPNDSSIQLGNLRNQHQQSSTALEGLRNERTSMANQVAATSSQIAEIESSLAAVRAAHETESKNVESLRTRLNETSTELNKLREEQIRSQSDLSALRQEKAEIEQQLLRDKEELRDLKKKTAEAADETKKLKDTLEKLRKDARQTKGLLAIEKKQLASAESDREKTRTAIQDEEAEQSAPISPPVPATSPFQPAAQVPLPATPDMLSPAASVKSGKSSTNPFERMGAYTPQPAGASNLGKHVAFGAAAAGVATAGAFAAHDAFSQQDLPAQNDIVESPKAESFETKSVDPFAVSTSSTSPFDRAPQRSNATGFDDDFGSPSTSAPSNFNNANAGFDDDFAAAFDNQVKIEQPTSPPAPGFDESFADFDQPKAATIPSVEAPQSHEDEHDEGMPKEIEQEDDSSDESSDEEQASPVMPQRDEERPASTEADDRHFRSISVASEASTNDKFHDAESARSTHSDSSDTHTLSRLEEEPTPAVPSSTFEARDDVTPGVNTETKNDFDDFEHDFEDLAPVQMQASTSSIRPTNGTIPVSGFTNSFEPDFGFDDNFAPSSSSRPAPPPPASEPFHTKTSSGASSSFDDAFADFDNAKPVPSSNNGSADAASTPKPIPPAIPPRKSTKTEPEELEDVRHLTEMGFSREAAIDALTRNDFNLQKATESLLG